MRVLLTYTVDPHEDRVLGGIISAFEKVEPEMFGRFFSGSYVKPSGVCVDSGVAKAVGFLDTETVRGEVGVTKRGEGFG